MVCVSGSAVSVSASERRVEASNPQPYRVGWFEQMARYNKGLIFWKSKMQKTVSLSTAEAEYYAASEMAIKIIYLCNLLSNMGFQEEPNTPVYKDNTACIDC